MNSTHDECYTRFPLFVDGGIPVFSESDSYMLNYDQISGDHVSEINNESENPFISDLVWNQMESGTLNLISKYAKLWPENDKVKLLDVGVGIGRLLKKTSEIQHTKFDVYGMDIAMPYLKLAKSKGLNVALSKIEDIPYKSSYFDIVTCTDVLEHVIDLNQCVLKILGVLKPKGILIVRVPNREDLSSYLKPDYPYHLAHVRTFDEYELELLFTRVFGQDFIEKQPGLLIESQSLLKYKVPVKGYNYLLKKMLRLAKRISQKQYMQLIEYFYHPTEINVVIRKKTCNLST